MRIDWNQDKNNLLKETRGVSFEQVEEEIFMNSPLDKEEQWYEDHSEDFVPMKNQEQLLILKNLRKKQALRIKILWIYTMCSVLKKKNVLYLHKRLVCVRVCM